MRRKNYCSYSSLKTHSSCQSHTKISIRYSNLPPAGTRAEYISKLIRHKALLFIGNFCGNSGAGSNHSGNDIFINRGHTSARAQSRESAKRNLRTKIEKNIFHFSVRNFVEYICNTTASRFHIEWVFRFHLLNLLSTCIFCE